VRRFEDFLCKSDHSSYATCCIVDYDEGHEAHPQTGTSRPLPDFWRSDCQSHEYRIKIAKIDWERQIELRKEGKGSQTHVDNSLLYFEESERRYQQHIRTEHRK
jgi:hypothetical protein